MVRVGIIGCGYWGPNLVRALNETPDCEVAAVSDIRPGRLEFIRRRFPLVETTQDTATLLQSSSIDALVISTPPATHYELAMAALRAGKHLLVEKPLAMTSEHAEAILTTAQRERKKLAVGHLFLYAPAVVTARSLIQGGELGQLYFLMSTRSNLGPPNTLVDALWDLAPHDISIILHLLQEYPSQVSARGASFTSTFAEAVFVSLAFPSGRMAQINVNWLTANKVRRLDVVGSRRALLFDDMEPVHKLKVFEAGADNRVNARDTDSAPLSYGPGGIWMPPLPTLEPLREECADFVQSIIQDREPISNGQLGVQVVKVLEAASRSMELNKQSQVAAVV